MSLKCSDNIIQPDTALKTTYHGPNGLDLVCFCNIFLYLSLKYNKVTYFVIVFTSLGNVTSNYRHIFCYEPIKILKAHLLEEPFLLLPIPLMTEHHE